MPATPVYGNQDPRAQPKQKAKPAGPAPTPAPSSGEGEIDRFMSAISGNESGGNYNAQNKSGAHGKYQIMPANWPAWSHEALGPGNWAQTPQNQEKVARFKMLQYYRKYHDWDAVAIAWFAGPGRADAYLKGDRSVLSISDGGTTVGAYVNKVHLAMGKPGDVIGGDSGGLAPSAASGTSGPGSLPANATPDQIEAYIRENYPQAAGFLDVPEIRGVLIKAAQENWTPTKLQAQIQATTWWRTNSDSTRAYYATKNTDPATYEDMVQKKIAEIKPEFEQLGLHVDIRAIAEASIKYGWTDQQLKENFVGHLEYSHAHGGIDSGSTVELEADSLAKMARIDYLVPVSKQDVEQWAIDIYSGKRTEEQFKTYLAHMASGRFPGLEAMGVTPGEYLAPIRNVIADTLELQPADVDLLDSKYSAVLQVQGDKGSRPMTISEAQKWARSQPGYLYTKGANDTAAAFAESIGQRFGAVAG